MYNTLIHLLLELGSYNQANYPMAQLSYKCITASQCCLASATAEIWTTCRVWLLSQLLRLQSTVFSSNLSSEKPTILFKIQESLTSL